jgi:hypothetical protein
LPSREEEGEEIQFSYPDTASPFSTVIFMFGFGLREKEESKLWRDKETEEEIERKTSEQLTEYEF